VAKREKLLRHARHAPHQLRFRDAVWIAAIDALTNRPV
jgi:hypothetical protein